MPCFVSHSSHLPLKLPWQTGFRNMLIQTKKRLTYICIAISYLLVGIQYAIIFPSLNLFISRRYGASTIIFGVIISAYSVSGFISGPILGYIVDKKRNSRTVVILGNIPNIIGNVMYMLGISPAFLVCSRLVCGIGSGSASAMFADIARSSSDSERTGIISIMMLFQEIGLLFAPVFAIVLRDVHFYIGPYLIDKFTAPGLVMAILYLVLQICYIFMYFNLSQLHETRQLENLIYQEKEDTVSRKSDVEAENSNLQVTCQNSSMNNLYQSDSRSEGSTMDKNMLPAVEIPHVLNIPTLQNNKDMYDEPIVQNGSPTDDYHERIMASMSSDMIESAERYIISMSDTESVVSGGSFRNQSTESLSVPNQQILSHRSRQLSPHNPTQIVNENPKKKDKNVFADKTNQINYKNEFLRDEIITLFGLQFISSFSQTTLETIITPLSKKLYNWSDLENSFFFLGAGITILLVFIILRFVSRCVSDRYLILFGLTSMIASYVWLIAFFVPSAVPDDMKSLPHIIVGALFDLFGLPVLMVCSPSLISKLISKESQGFAQGFRRSCLFIGLIMGPLWGGSTVKMMNVLFGVPLAVLLVVTLLFLISFRKFKTNSSLTRLPHRESDPNTNEIAS